MPSKQIFLIAISCFLLATEIASLYTNEQALACFGQKALQLCERSFTQCVEDQDCQKELYLYNRCSFGDNLNQSSYVFNGYCFKRWEDKAILTKQLISCMNSACDLTYNSELGLKQLFDCTQWIMFEDKIECDDECALELQQKIGKQFYTLPFAQLYSQKLQNEEAQALLYKILNECIRDGRGKEMIYSEERLKEEELLGISTKEESSPIQEATQPEL